MLFTKFCVARENKNIYLKKKFQNSKNFVVNLKCVNKSKNYFINKIVLNHTKITIINHSTCDTKLHS